MNRSTTTEWPLWIFFSLVFILSVPLWLIGAMTDLPISVLNAVNPLTAASILTYRQNGPHGVKELLRRSVDFRNIANKRWYVPTFGLLPITYVLAHGLMVLSGASPPDPPSPMCLAPVFFVLFFILALGEEVGWPGYAIDRLQNRRSALEASLIVGVVWATWHAVPDVQAHHSFDWILWQRLYTVGLRVLIVWLYNNTRRSVFAATVFYATDNVSFLLFPNSGSHYDPFFTSLITAFTASIVIVVWCPETLARYRHARSGGSHVGR